MFDYKTVEEKAAEWELSVRHIQTLCRQGKVPGAIKRAGAWFIPETAARPSIRISLNGHYLMFKGTKKKIFEKAVELFAGKSYEVVTLKDIADKVGIGQSAVYNHFKSKQEILETIYNYYCHYYIEDRPQLASLEPIIMHGSLLDIINCIYYTFKEEYNDLLIFSTKIIMQRAFIDERAREIFRKLMIEEGVLYVEQFFNRTIEVGRLAPFDTHAMSLFFNMNRLFLYLRMLTEDPDKGHFESILADQNLLSQYAMRYLTDLDNINTK